MDNAWVAVLVALIGGVATVTAAIIAARWGRSTNRSAAAVEVVEHVAAPMRHAAQAASAHRPSCSVSVTVGLALALLVGIGALTTSNSLFGDGNDDGFEEEDPTALSATEAAALESPPAPSPAASPHAVPPTIRTSPNP